MSKCKGYAAEKAKAALGPWEFERREPSERDVVIDIKYCGICHSDIHQARDEWSQNQRSAIFPMSQDMKLPESLRLSGKTSQSTKSATRLELVAL